MSELPNRERAHPGSAAFGWEKKLHEADEFSSVFRFKCLQRGDYLDLYARPNGLELARLGLVVPKRVLARAVDRNRVKRILREAFRQQQTALNGLDVIFRLRAASQAGSSGYRDDSARLLQRALRCAQNRADK